VWRLGREDAAEDVVQSTLVAAVRALHSWRGEAALFTWLCTLCRHEISAFVRRANRGPEVRAIDDDPDLRAQLNRSPPTSTDRIAASSATSWRCSCSSRSIFYRTATATARVEYVDGLTVAEIAAPPSRRRRPSSRC
jgi:RNA polymerase sigma-70 factor (ECF subfamily)